MLLSAKTIAAGENPVSQEFDPSRWNQLAVDKASEVPATVFLDEIFVSHKHWSAFLVPIPSKDLRRRGPHARGDALKVAGCMGRYAEHGAHHAVEIHSAVRAAEREHPQKHD